MKWVKLMWSREKRSKFSSDLLSSQGYTPSSGSAMWWTLAGFIATCSVLPQTPLNPLQLLWWALLLSSCWDTLGDKEEGSARKGSHPLFPYLLVLFCPLSELECASYETLLIRRTWKSHLSSWDFTSIFVPNISMKKRVPMHHSLP